MFIMGKLTEVYIFSRPIRSGKTSTLLEWSQKQAQGSVAGVLAPDIEGRRWLMDLSTNEKRLLSADAETEEKRIVQIGRYRFNQTAFHWAHRVLRSGFEQVPQWLVFDEIGYLELQGQGLEPAVRRILNWNKRIGSTKLLWVVRDELLHEVLDYYGLSDEEWQEWVI
jgi:nucleoside-triphosphatase